MLSEYRSSFELMSHDRVNRKYADVTFTKLLLGRIRLIDAENRRVRGAKAPVEIPTALEGAK
jgi:hypothetical protein